MVSLMVSLVLAPAPRVLEQTAEWVAYQHALAAAKSYSVTVSAQGTSEKAFGDWGRQTWAAGTKNGTIVVNEQLTEEHWNGKVGFHLDMTSKTWSPISRLEDSSIVFMLGLPKYGFCPQGDHLFRLTRTAMNGVGKGTVEVGWEVVQSGRDYTVRSVLWFDRLTHLISGASRIATGTVDGAGAMSPTQSNGISTQRTPTGPCLLRQVTDARMPRYAALSGMPAHFNASTGVRHASALPNVAAFEAGTAQGVEASLQTGTRTRHRHHQISGIPLHSIWRTGNPERAAIVRLHPLGCGRRWQGAFGRAEA